MIKSLETIGLQVKEVVVLIDRMQGGKDENSSMVNTTIY